MDKIKNVLFYCAGNEYHQILNRYTCRSPFAEAFSKWLKETKFKEELKDVEFDSAGIYHYYETPQEGTIKYLKSKGIEVNDFSAKRIDEDLIERQDLMLGFEQKRHIDKLKRKFKHIKDLDKKLVLLLRFSGETQNLDIEDPFHLEQEDYNKILKRIEFGVLKTIEKIIEINKKEILTK